MFSIIPQTYDRGPAIFSRPESITSFVTGSSKLLVPGKVTAASNLPQGAVSGFIGSEEILGQPDIVQISVGINAVGSVDLEENSKKNWSNHQIHWARALRLSDDCHSYNIQLKIEKTESGPASNNLKLFLQVVRPIEAGQELLLWFSAEILTNLQIAFLTPTNIQGQKKYVCTKCSALYESPNPLKLHISLSCGRHPISHLWERLSHNLINNVPEETPNRQLFEFKLSPERQKTAIDLSVSSSSARSPPREIFKPYQAELGGNSAFKPFKRGEEAITPFPHVDNSQMWALAPFEHQQYGGEDEAHIETLVSSLGKSKQGHICLYCGKCYSRKYGLKIHIRTHTGYKPLKCKFCMRPFGDPSNLNKHVRLHAEGNTPYKCDLCGKILVRRRDLDRHLKSRHMIEMHPEMTVMEEGDFNPDDELKLSGDENKEDSKK